MQLSIEQLQDYEENGFLLLPSCFLKSEIDILKGEVPALFGEDSPRRVIEKDGQLVRSVYGSHTTNDVFRRLSRHPRIVEPIIQILGSPVYVYQFKINAKAAFGGDIWDWHQDYVFWRKEDGMPKARVINAAIYLDDVTEFNGPLFLMPGSHKKGMIDVPARDNGSGYSTTYQNSPAWISNLTANIKYSIDKVEVAELARQYGMVAPNGPRGSVLFSHGNIVHASPNNISPFDRVIIFITYNSTENIPVTSGKPRPDFLSGRDYEPVVPLPDETLLA